MQRLEHYRCPPSVVIASGGSPGHAHAYWQLQQPVDLDELERRQPPARDAGSAATSPPSTPRAFSGRQPPGTDKHTPPTRVELLVLAAPSPLQARRAHRRARRPSPTSTSRRSAQSRTATSELDRQLLAIPAASYVPALTGRQPNRAGKIRCPFPRRPHPQPPALRARLVLLRSLPHRRHHLRLRRAALRPRHQRTRVPPAPPAPRRRAVAAQASFPFGT